MRPRTLLVAVCAGATVALYARVALACGCFTPPDPSVPVVQAGERIVFAMEGGEVVAHIQIQYKGAAEEFGWLLPLPSVPTLELGTDELFTQLVNQTQPKYRLQRRFEGNCLFAQARSGGAFGGSPSAGPPSEDGSSGGSSVLVLQDTIGPFDYAVLRADGREEMFQWLSDNRYFVPVGTEDAVGPYIRPGAYFLALKLRSGQSVGDLQPVVVRYASDLPMIPIVLTSVAATPNMGIQVWMLGNGRAIPRNYHHNVVNDALIDWQNAGQNYNDVIIRAVSEAPRKHAFVTEYAGASTLLRGQLDWPGRFGSVSALAAQPDAYAFVEYLWRNGFTLTGQLGAILGRYIPFPAGLAAQGVSAAEFYQSLRYYLTTYRQGNPQAFEGWAGIDFQPAAMAAEIDERVIRPTREASALFDRFPVLTRLYTTLSPQDMTRDPVFSFNPALPNVSNVHQATLTYKCNVFFGSSDINTTPAQLVTEQGWVVNFPDGTRGGSLLPRVPLPFSTSVQILREEGPPEILTDNRQRIRSALQGPSGCSVAGGGAAGIAALLVIVALGAARARRRRSCGGRS